MALQDIAVFAAFVMFAVFAIFAKIAKIAKIANFATVLMGIGCLRTWMESILSVSLYGQFPALPGGIALDPPYEIGQPQGVAPTRLSCLSRLSQHKSSFASVLRLSHLSQAF